MGIAAKEPGRRMRIVRRAGLRIAQQGERPATRGRAPGQPLRWRMVTAWPRRTPGPGVAAERLAAAVTAMSGGRLRVEVVAAGEGHGPLDVLSLVGSGRAELGHATPHYWSSREPLLDVFSGVPFGLTAEEHAGWLANGGGQAFWTKACAPLGVVPFLAGSSGPQAGGWFRKRILRPEDFRGLKIRIAGLGAGVLKRLGAVPVMLPPGRLRSALQSGEIDAAEWVGPWNDVALGLDSVAKLYYLPAFHELAAALELTVNVHALASLPDDLAEIVRQAAAAAAHTTLAEFSYRNARAFPALGQRGVEVLSFPDAVVDALARESEAALSAVAASSALAGDTVASLRRFRDEAARYGRACLGRGLAMRERALIR